MLQDAILQCETSTELTREARPRRVGPKRRGGRAHESRSRFVDMDDQWTFQCEIQKRHPLRDETSTDETTPKPDRPRPHLGRNRVLAYGPVTFPHSGVSRMSASVRLMIQGHSARRVTSRVRQCHQLIKISEIKSEAYTVHLRFTPPFHEFELQGGMQKVTVAHDNGTVVRTCQSLVCVASWAAS